MKSIVIISTVVLLLGIAGTTLADRSMHEGMNAGNNAGNSMPGMMNMQEMQKYMTDMRGTMDKIHATKDEKQRQKLMDQHMQEMQKGMGAMQGMMQGIMMGDMDSKNMPHQGNGNMPGDKDMHNRQNMMDKRMNMMQMMMGQMMDHMMQDQSMGMDKR